MNTLNRGRHSTAFWLAACAALAVMAFYLWTEHRAHTLGALPWLILLACPLLHVFMHRGHGGHGDHGGAGENRDPHAGHSHKHGEEK